MTSPNNIPKSCIKNLRDLTLGSLNQSQKDFLLSVSQEPSRTISEVVKKITKDKQTSESTIWKSIQQLRSKNLLTKSGKLSLTPTGRFLVEEKNA
ncbi:hypothetical protein CMI48_00725 [Candidatus Pacearchaeota archaeon]|jgi:predicted transcriptional regulator|nr:hypothetical protein [Candidatus Pacearchaeota archaeon]|tara:strand:- start:267 stop:551 length:285 start_codon:yes stop_codon:yes gene_type:complete